MSAKAIIDRLLDAAFNELQHDTGPSDPEYRHQRSVLEAKFSKIMMARRSAVPEEHDWDERG